MARTNAALTSNDAVNWGPSFYPDSRHIVYSTSTHGHQNYEIYWMDTETRQAGAKSPSAMASMPCPCSAADGKKLMWTSKGRTADKTSQLWIADFAMEPVKAASR